MQSANSIIMRASKANSSEGKSCPMCQKTSLRVSLNGEISSIFRCTTCGFRFQHPQPDDEQLRQIYSANYFLGATDPHLAEHVCQLKTATANFYLDIVKTTTAGPKRLLEIGCGDGYLLSAAESRGYEVTGIDYSEHAARRAQEKLKNGRVFVGDISTANLPQGHFDFCILADVLEHVRDPDAFLRATACCLKPGGRILIATPSTDSWSALIMGARWMEYKTEHMSYFNRTTLTTLLAKSGFSSVDFLSGTKVVSDRKSTRLNSSH